MHLNKRWLTAIREGGLLDEGGSGKRWKLSCKHNTQRQANRFAAADWDDVEIVAMNHDEICDGTSQISFTTRLFFEQDLWLILQLVGKLKL